MKLRLLLLLFSPVLAFSQKMPEIEALNRVILNHKDSIIYAYLLPTEDGEKVKVSDKYWYNWYAQHDIKETRGGFDGKLLHGQYTEYYESKDLKKKGILKKGLKRGKWKSWYKNGQISEIVYYKNGLKDGKFILFTSSGKQIEKGKYNKGVKKIKRKKKEADNFINKDTIDLKNRENKKNRKSKKEKKDILKSTIQEKSELKKEEKNKKKKKEKDPQIRIRRGIKIIPLPGKST
jgi:hypothetical protein